ncbi:hypothetical protein BH09BAC6_BH09BAC6_25350 [soil metagenome]
MVLVIILLMLETSFFYAGFKSGNLLMAQVKGVVGVMPALVLLSLGIKWGAAFHYLPYSNLHTC